MISPNEAYLMPSDAVPRAKGPAATRWRTCRAIKPAPVHMGVRFDIEPMGDARVVHTEVLVEMSGLEADLLFRDAPDAFGFAGWSATASAQLLPRGECFIPPPTTVHVPTSAGALLGVELRDGELAPLGKVIPIPPVSVGTASMQTTFDVLASIGVSFSWVGSDSRPEPEILLGGDIRFLRGVVGRLMLRGGSPGGTSSRRLNLKDVTLLKPGQVIHFPQQFVPVAGKATDLDRIRYTFGPAPRQRVGLRRAKR